MTVDIPSVVDILSIWVDFSIVRELEEEMDSVDDVTTFSLVFSVDESTVITSLPLDTLTSVVLVNKVDCILVDVSIGTNDVALTVVDWNIVDVKSKA